MNFNDNITLPDSVPRVPQFYPGTNAFTFDTTINKILSLNDYENKLGKFLNINNYRLLDQKTVEEDYYPSIYCISKGEKEYLMMSWFYGGGCCAYFEVGNYISKKRKIIKTTYQNFYTESGIKLGITKQQFLKIRKEVLSNEFTGKGYDTLEYRWGTAPYRQYGKDDPYYIAWYVFRDNKLIKFAFGYLPAFPYTKPSIIQSEEDKTD